LAHPLPIPITQHILAEKRSFVKRKEYGKQRERIWRKMAEDICPQLRKATESLYGDGQLRGAKSSS
jgi:hypothetical protein